jgi:hypothetical protein
VPIPEPQLKEWSQRGPAQAAADTLAAVTQGLAALDIKRFGRPEISLGGAFATETDTAADSEVDLIVLLRDVFHPDISELNAHDRAIYERERSAGRFSILEARAHVQSLLGKHFGDDNVRLGPQAIRVDGADGRLPANVYAACGHKYFYTFPSKPAARYVEGIVYTDYQGTEHVSYPAQHIANGEAKAKAVSAFRPAVRACKSLAAHLATQGKLREGTWSPYFVECLVYSVPNSNFFSSLESTLLSVLLHWSSSKPKWDELLQQNQVLKLFGAKESQWDKAHAEAFVDTCRSAWDSWGA